MPRARSTGSIRSVGHSALGCSLLHPVTLLGFALWPFLRFAARPLPADAAWLVQVEACGQADVGDKAMAELRRLLQAVIERGTGRAAKIGRPACGKTGTSDGFRDVWFAGFTPQMTSVVSPLPLENQSRARLLPRSPGKVMRLLCLLQCRGSLLLLLFCVFLLTVRSACGGLQVWLGYDNNLTVGGTHPGTPTPPIPAPRPQSLLFFVWQSPGYLQRRFASPGCFCSPLDPCRPCSHRRFSRGPSLEALHDEGS